MMVRSRRYVGGFEVALPIEDVFISHITDGKPTEVWRKA
jgi:hypothetical protein